MSIRALTGGNSSRLRGRVRSGARPRVAKALGATLIASACSLIMPAAAPAAAATHFTVSAPLVAMSGTAINFTVTARDATNAVDAAYGGTVHFTSSDGSATLPANSTLSSGVGTFSATLQTAPGPQTITATDTVTSSITGTSNPILVLGIPGPATHFTVSAPSAVTGGTAFNFNVTARDASGGVATGYSGTVHFTSSDGAATLPANSTLTNGTGTFSATLRTEGAQGITATDTTNSSITGTSSPITVSNATHFAVAAPAAATAGSPFSFTVTAKNANGSTDTGFTGSVRFSSSDGNATLPFDSGLASGTGTFNATLRGLGTRTITATQNGNPSVTGTSGPISVHSANALKKGFRLGRLVRNKNRGTAILIVDVPAPGTVRLRGNGVVKQRHARHTRFRIARFVNSAGRVKLPIRAKGKAKRRLNEKGKVRVTVRVTFTPVGGTPRTRSRGIALIKRP
jgi:hypothetical protein